MIYHTIKIKRGLLANLPTLSAGELAYTTDTKELYIGTSTGTNIRLTYDGVELDIDALEADLNEAFTRNYAQDKKLEDLERSIKSSLVGDYFGSLDINGLVEHLPATVAKAPLKVVGKGLSLEQVVENGDFSSTDISDWTDIGSSSTVVTNNELVMNYTSSYCSIYQEFENIGVVGDKVLITIKQKPITKDGSVTAPHTKPITIKDYSDTTILSQPTFTADLNIWETQSVIVTLIDSGLRIAIGRGFTSTQELHYDDLMIIPLTNTPLASYTAQQISALGLPYWEGLKHVVNPTVEAVGKNLFDGELEQGGLSTISGAETVLSNRVRSNFIRIDALTDYTSSNLSTGNIYTRGLFYYDIDYNYLSWNAVGAAINVTDTSPLNAAYVRILYSYSDTTTDIDVEDVEDTTPQLEQGTVATTYEPYAKQSKTFVGTFRSVGAVQDEFRDGSKIKKVGRDYNDVVQSATTWSVDNELTNTVRCYEEFDGLLDFKLSLGDANVSNIYLKIGDDIYPSVSKTYLVSTDTIGVALDASVNRLFVRFDKTTIGGNTADAFETYLQANDVEFIYELATPVEEPISVLGSPILIGEPRGQIRQTSLNGAVDVYSASTGIVVTDPIEEVTELIKLNTDGTQELLDLSNVTIAGDSLSFTSTDLSEGDAIYYTYKPIEARINGSLSIDYYTNDVVVDDVTGDIYKWNVVASNGVLSLEGEVIG